MQHPNPSLSVGFLGYGLKLDAINGICAQIFNSNVKNNQKIYVTTAD